jgi:hypothetical protein
MRKTMLARMTLAGVALAAVLLFAPTSVVADHDRHGCDHHRGKGHQRHRSHHHSHGDFLVPLSIRFDDVYRYRPYYERRAYYRPHRHHHVIYSFPVYTEYGVTYHPYAYCSGPRGFVAFQSPRAEFYLGF